MTPYYIRVTDRAGCSFNVPCSDFATCLREGARLAAAHPDCLIDAFGDGSDSSADGGFWDGLSDEEAEQVAEVVS